MENIKNKENTKTIEKTENQELDTRATELKEDDLEKVSGGIFNTNA